MHAVYMSLEREARRRFAVYYSVVAKPMHTLDALTE